MPPARTRIVVVEDHPIFRDGLIKCLDAEPDFRVVGYWETGAVDAKALARLTPDLVLMDIELPGQSGIDATRVVRATLPDLRVVMLTAFADAELLFDAMQAGAVGYLLKHTPPVELVATLRRIVQGEHVLTPNLASRFLREFQARQSVAPRVTPVPPSSPSKRASWSHRIHPPGAPMRDAPFAWLHHLHPFLALAGLYWFDLAAWPVYLLVFAILAIEWPFCIRLADDVEIYFPVEWTSAAAAYLLGPVILPLYWTASLAGFVLIVVLDSRGIVPALGMAAESARRYRGEPFALDTVVDGELRHFHLMSQMAVRVAAFALTSRAGMGLFPGVLASEGAVMLWDRIVPIPGRMAPARMRARLAAALGTDLVRASRLLDVSAMCWLLLAHAQGGPLAFAGASLMTITLHAVLKRLTDMRGEVERRQRLAVIGQTASTVFHQLGRHHGAIGMYAHLLTRGEPAVADHARRILASVDDANRVIDELLAFGQDRTLNLYPHRIDAVLAECIDECRPRAAARDVTIDVGAATPIEITLDKHKIKQALGNVLDNAIDAAPCGSTVEITTSAPNGVVRVAVRDHGAGVAAEIRNRLFTPFCTTKPDGVGVGLALAKELVDAHGGRLEWEQATPGARFTITLPRR